MKKTRSNGINQQAGVTLLLAVLVLAAITAIAFSLAAIITVEIRSSGDVLRTEPALYAVQGVAEEAFFKYTRSVANSSLDIATNDNAGDTTGCTSTAPNVCLLNGVSLGNPPPRARQLDPAPRVDVIAAATTNRYLFIDPAQPNDFGQAFSSISVTELNGILGVTAVFNKCCDAVGNKIVVRTDNLSPNVKDTLTISDTGQYELAVQNPNSAMPLLVQIDGQMTSNGSHQIPLVGRHVLDITASYLGLTRKYSVDIPFAPSPGP
jgi:hypothetical protein